MKKQIEIRFRMSPEQHEKIQKAAEAEGLTSASFARMKTLRSLREDRKEVIL